MRASASAWYRGNRTHIRIHDVDTAMNPTRTLVLVTLTLSLCVLLLAPAVSAVPDARITVEEVEVSDTTPDPGDIVTFSVTLTNSAGSPSAVDIDRLQLRERDGGPFESVDRATANVRSGVGALSPGDSTTVSLTASFEEVGQERLDVYVRGEDENRGVVTVRRPVDVFVGGVDVEEATTDVGVDARFIEQPTDEEEGGDDLSDIVGGGGLGTDDIEGEEVERDDVFEVRVTNFGNVEVRDAVVTPSADGETLPRIAVGDIGSFGEETVTFEPSAVRPTTYEFEVGYRSGGNTETATYSVDYVPDTARLTVTGVSMERDGDGAVVVTGNVGNVGSAEARGTVVSVGEAEGVAPVYPSADDFVGTVPESDFTFFELTADVDDASHVPVDVRYTTEGEEAVESFELGVDVTETETDEANGTSPLVYVAAGVVLVVVLTVAVWRSRRKRSQGDG